MHAVVFSWSEADLSCHSGKIGAGNITGNFVCGFLIPFVDSAMHGKVFKHWRRQEPHPAVEIANAECRFCYVMYDVLLSVKLVSAND